MKRPTQLYKNSTRLCVTLNIRGTPAYMSGLSVRLDRIGHGCVPKVCAPCPKNVFEDVQVQDEVVPPAVNSVTLPLIENRPDGSTCALITTELRDLEPGRYKVTVVGNDECDQCFSVDLLDSCGTVEAYSETPDGCITCDSAIPPPAPAPAPAPSPVPFPLESDTPFWDPSGTPLSPFPPFTFQKIALGVPPIGDSESVPAGTTGFRINIEAQNVSGSPMDGATIEDILDSCYTCTASSVAVGGGGRASGTFPNWTVDSWPDGAFVTIDLTVTFNTVGMCTNTARLVGPLGEILEATCSVDVF